MLNIGTSRVSTLCLVLVVIISFVLQSGVLILAGFTAKRQSFAASLPSVDEDKTEPNKQLRMAPKYAFPTMTAGTVSLGLGMLCCAWIIIG